MFKVVVHTDGSCKGNPGPGGYGAILVCKDKEKVVRGYDCETTNNRMELLAVLEALRALKKPCEITISTDSRYLILATSHDDDWLLRPNRPNRDLWQIFIDLKKAGKHKIAFQKVKGHSGEVYNERCDRIAKEQARKACHILLKGGQNV